MFRNQYDNDTTTFSPQGRLHQLEYSLEAVKQGSTCIALTSSKSITLIALKRSQSPLSSHQNKLTTIGKYCVAFAGLSSDARVLTNYMRSMLMKERMVFGRECSLFRVVAGVGDKAQLNTQAYGSSTNNRPYGVGFLVAGVDETGPHLFEFSPTGTFYEYVANAIGAKSQTAKSYLEKHLDKFEGCSDDELVEHGLRALSAVQKLEAKECQVVVVKSDGVVVIKEEEVEGVLRKIEGSVGGMDVDQ